MFTISDIRDRDDLPGDFLMHPVDYDLSVVTEEDCQCDWALRTSRRFSELLREEGPRRRGLHMAYNLMILMEIMGNDADDNEEALLSLCAHEAREVV